MTPDHSTQDDERETYPVDWIVVAAAFIAVAGALYGSLRAHDATLIANEAAYMRNDVTSTE